MRRPAASRRVYPGGRNGDQPRRSPNRETLCRRAALGWLVLVLCVAGCAPAADVRIGSKQQPESEILGEMATLLARSTGARAEHRPALGGTGVLWNALLKGEIDAYPEYTGTISAEI